MSRGRNQTMAAPPCAYAGELCKNLVLASRPILNQFHEPWIGIIKGAGMNNHD